MEQELFDQTLAQECALAFSESTGLGCALSDSEGNVFADYGYSCEKCRLCAAVGRNRDGCIRAHNYGMTEAQRFGGKYIYFCPMGLTCFVSPILGEDGARAKITVGPFIMVDKQDYIDCELLENGKLDGARLQAALDAVENVPITPPQKVNHLATLLFMAVGFMNNVSAENQLLANQRSDAIQGQVTAYILTLKQEGKEQHYPIDLERRLLQSVEHHNREETQRLLNELLGAILFSDSGQVELVKTRVYELLVLMSRAAINNGADADRTLQLNHEYLKKLMQFTSIDQLCLWLSDALNSLMHELFTFADAKHANVLHRCVQYIGEHYSEPITLTQVAEKVYLTPTYLCRVFKKEAGVTFNEYLNRVRINKAKDLLRNRDLRLTDISLMVGFEDQSYFTKVFKRMTGTLPRAYRESLLGK